MKKLLNVIKMTVYICAVVVLVLSVGCQLMHIKPAVVISGSMEPAIRTGSIVLIDESKRNIHKGDIVAFKAGATTVVHRVIDITDGKYVTKGDSNDSSDIAPVYRENIIGLVIMDIPGLGYAVNWLTTAPGIMIIAAIAAGLIVAGYLAEREEMDEEK